MNAGTPSSQAAIESGSEQNATLHDALIVLRLAAYAADAMRVLQSLTQHADRDPALDASLRAACPDWRNPGCLNDPADLVREALAHASAEMSVVLRGRV